MSDFIANNLHKKVDQIMDVFFGAGVASHPTIIEQINYLLFMRALAQRDDELRLLGVNNPNEIVFDGELEKYHWDNLLALNAEALFNALEECFRKIPDSTTNKTVRLVFRNAHIKLFDKPSLRTVLHQINEFGKAMDESEHEGKRDVFGDTYEYLLSKLAQAGTSGQFRTPRHIIEFIVDVVAPKKGETIIDPAVGTAGFLVKAFEYLRKEYTNSETLETGGQFDQLSSQEHTFLLEHTFAGFDSDEDMIKFGMMNLYLHGLKDAKLVRQNTLTDTAGSRDKYDVVLANPPFSGKIDRDSVAEELQMNTGATEVLFLRYMIRHLTDNGRAGVIVPEGVLFNSSGAHTKIRELLLQNGLWCVASLPAGVFNPYAGVKTSILFFDKTHTKQEVLFAKIEHDGFSLSAQRRPTPKNDLPEILEDIRRYQKGEELQLPNAHAVSYEKIQETKDFNLSGDRYTITETIFNQDYETVTLGELEERGDIEFLRGANLSKKDIVENGKNPCIHYGELYTLYEPSIKTVISHTNETGKVKSIAGDVLIPATTTADAMGIAIARSLNQNDVILGGDINVMRTRNKVLLADFIAWLISTDLKPQLAAYAKGINIVHLSNSDVRKLRIPLPPLEVQQKIVAEIENKQKAIDHAREIIATLERERAYFDPSARAARENWPIVKLADITKLVRGPFGGSLKKEIFKTTGYKVYEQNDAIYGKHHETRYFIDSTKFDEMKRFQVASGDLIMSCSGTVGRIAVIGEGAPEGVINQALLKITPDDKVLSTYLKLFFESDIFQQTLSSNSQGGVIKNVVSVKQLSQLSVPLPPLETQEQIAAQFAEEAEIITANRKLITLYEAKIADTLANI